MSRFLPMRALNLPSAAFLPIALTTALSTIACGPPPPPPDNPQNDGPAPTTKKAVPMIESEIGALDANKVQAVFQSASESLKECYARGVGKIGFLAGDIKLAVRVSEDGSAKYVYVKDSTLGDRSTESCMVSVLKGKSWPKPVGGKEGNAETSFSFDPGDEERPPVEWSEARMGDGYKKAKPTLSKCKADAGAGPLKVTLYVETDGKALGIGVSGTDAKAEQAASCIVSTLQSVKFASPGSYAAKVTVTVD
ncbi:MAG: AgmX/PglI C-terminal domain-containing protein [Polyangiaceae bacterium]|nr:AgmX/PglI C-terminal domain-containing protein [Polyangiaceae bacterium]